MFTAKTALVPIMAFILALGLPVAGCEKDGDSTASPADAGGKQASGISLRYGKQARTLKQTTHFEFKLSGGGQYGELDMALEATLNLAIAGDDTLKVGWKIDAIDSLELKGMFKPKQKKGEAAPPDPKAILIEKGSGAWVMDLRGEPDKEATKALSENVAKREEKKKSKEADDGRQGEEAGKQLLAYMEGVFQLPTLPEKNLEVGKALVIEEEEEASLGGEDGGGPILPIESETTYTLIKVDDSGDKRIAEFQVEVEASGAIEFQGGMLVVDQSTEGVLLFNIDDGVPVHVQLTSSQSFALNDQGSELTTILESSFEPG